MKFFCGNCGHIWIEDVMEFTMFTSTTRKCPECGSKCFHKIGVGTNKKKEGKE